MPTEADDDLRDLMRDYLREQQRERIAGHTLAIMHDDVRAIGASVAALTARVTTLETRVPSVRPGPARHRLDSVAEIRPTDPPEVAAFKQEDLAPVVAAVKMTRLLWRVAVAFFALAATVVTTYAAVKGLK